MKTLFKLSLVGILSWSSISFAGDPDPKAVVAPEAPYEGGRGLITLQGPTGLFINPTSGTMPAGAATVQYCLFSPNVDSNVIGNGLLIAYGITDWLEFAVLTSYVNISDADDLAAAGPQVRARLIKNEGFIPQISVGYYGRYGDSALVNSNIYAAAYNRIPLAEDGVVKSLGLHYGIRNSWADSGDNSDLRGYGGVEIQLPLRVYLVGEISTENQNTDAPLPYSYGAQWRLGAINISVAMIRDGDLATDDAGFYFGIGSQFSF